MFFIKKISISIEKTNTINAIQKPPFISHSKIHNPTKIIMQGKNEIIQGFYPIFLLF